MKAVRLQAYGDIDQLRYEDVAPPEVVANWRGAIQAGRNRQRQVS